MFNLFKRDYNKKRFSDAKRYVYYDGKDHIYRISRYTIPDIRRLLISNLFERIINALNDRGNTYDIDWDIADTEITSNNPLGLGSVHYDCNVRTTIGLVMGSIIITVTENCFIEKGIINYYDDEKGILTFDQLIDKLMSDCQYGAELKQAMTGGNNGN